MLSGIYQWVRNIAVYLIFMSLLLKLLPEKKYIKYIRYFMGMILILIVLAPAGKVFHLNEILDALEEGFEASAADSQFRAELSLMGTEYSRELISQYEAELSRKTAEKIREEGLGDAQVAVEIDSDAESDSFGQVVGAVISCGQGGTEDGQIVIERKEVKILNEEISYKEQAEYGELKKIAASCLGIPEDQILVEQ